MKHYFLLLLSFPFLSFGQDAKGNCSHVKSAHKQLKSNTFTVAQIAETERYDVHFYFLDLNMTNTTTTLSGTVEIHASARENLDSALLELFPTFVINSIEVDGTPVAYSRVATALKVPVNATQNQSFVIRVDYQGTPPTAASNPLGGSGMTNDFSPSWGNQVTWSLSEPFSAYEWFPVKQSLRDKADSSAMHITVPTSCKAGSNGILEQVVDLGNGTHRFEWKHRHPIDYYLISVAIAHYVEYTVTANPSNSGPVTIQNFIYDNPQTLLNFQSDIDETADFIELYADLFGPYPFADEKYGHCMAPLGGGMEHQTMTTQGSFSKGLTSHELAHQWWGDHVTCASWADIWVNEGFASYSECLMLENLYPGQQQTDMLDRHDNIMSQPDGSVWVEDSLNEGRIFSGRLTYDKGAAIVHTLRFLINNDSLFFAGLQQYQTLYADSTALGVDFIQVMEDVSGMDFTNYFEEWYFGEGFPTYSTRWNMVGNDLLVEISQTASASAITPLFTNDLEIRFDRQVLTDTIIRFPINAATNQYVIPNAGNVVNVLSLDPKNWIINAGGSIVHDVNFVSVGVLENTLANAVTISPNPTEGPFTVAMQQPGKYTLTIIDTKGRAIKTVSFEQETLIDLGTAAQGTYVLQINDANSDLKVRRLVKH
jgi:aminopeptidase N